MSEPSLATLFRLFFLPGTRFVRLACDAHRKHEVSAALLPGGSAQPGGKEGSGGKVGCGGWGGLGSSTRVVSTGYTERTVHRLLEKKCKSFTHQSLGGCKWKNLCFYIAQYPDRWTAQSTLDFLPRQTCSFPHQLDFIQATLQLRAKAIQSCFTIWPSIARFALIQLSELGHREENENTPSIETVAKGIEPGLYRLRVWHSTAELPLYFDTSLDPSTKLICDPSVQNQSHVAENINWVFHMCRKRRRWVLIWCKKTFICDN